MSKGSKRRKCIVSRVEETLRWRLYQGRITREEFDAAMEDLKDAEK